MFVEIGRGCDHRRAVAKDGARDGLDNVPWDDAGRRARAARGHGTTLAGAPALRVAFVITTAPLALAAASTMMLLARRRWR